MKNEEQQMKSVVALSYDMDSDTAPKVIGKGRGDVADRIIAVAKEHEIPIQEDRSLVELLSKLEINETIPEPLYEVVAELFAFIYQIDQTLKK